MIVCSVQVKSFNLLGLCLGHHIEICFFENWSFIRVISRSCYVRRHLKKKKKIRNSNDLHSLVAIQNTEFIPDDSFGRNTDKLRCSQNKVVMMIVVFEMHLYQRNWKRRNVFGWQSWKDFHVLKDSRVLLLLQRAYLGGMNWDWHI